MNPDQMSSQMPAEMTPDEAAASLAFATHLSEQMMPRPQIEAPEAPQSSETAPGEAMPQETSQPTPEDLEALIDERAGKVVEEKLSAFREEMAKTMSGEENKTEDKSEKEEE